MYVCKRFQKVLTLSRSTAKKAINTISVTRNKSRDTIYCKTTINPKQEWLTFTFDAVTFIKNINFLFAFLEFIVPRNKLIVESMRHMQESLKTILKKKSTQY